MHYVMMYMYVEHYKDAPEQLVVQNEEPLIMPYKGKGIDIPQTEEQLKEMCPYVPINFPSSIKIPVTWPYYVEANTGANREDQSFFKDSKELLETVEVEPTEVTFFTPEEKVYFSSALDVAEKSLNEMMDKYQHIKKIKQIVDKYVNLPNYPDELAEKYNFCVDLNEVLLESKNPKNALETLDILFTNAVGLDFTTISDRHKFVSLYEKELLK